MVGTRQFDHDTVVDRAMMLFWRRGYGRTSIQDLEKATRLRRGSLYNTFGDKQGLFVAALKRYETTVGQERIKHLSNPDPYRAIEGFLEILEQIPLGLNRRDSQALVNERVCPP